MLTRALTSRTAIRLRAGLAQLKMADFRGFSSCERYAAARSSAMIARANGTHWPHFGWRPSAR
jgi:hypothetical protein